jgi:hypothetical protein
MEVQLNLESIQSINDAASEALNLYYGFKELGIKKTLKVCVAYIRTMWGEKNGYKDEKEFEGIIFPKINEFKKQKKQRLAAQKAITSIIQKPTAIQTSLFPEPKSFPAPHSGLKSTFYNH